MARANNTVADSITMICIAIECGMVRDSKILKQAVKSLTGSQTVPFKE